MMCEHETLFGDGGGEGHFFLLFASAYRTRQ